MFRLIGLVLALAIVGWLMTRQVDDVRQTTRSAAKSAGAVGIKIDDNASPRDIAAQVGKAVEIQVQGSKARVDAFENANGGGSARDESN